MKMIWHASIHKMEVGGITSLVDTVAASLERNVCQKHVKMKLSKSKQQESGNVELHKSPRGSKVRTV